MLRQLHIKNLAIIDEVQLDFAAGFTVLTGETGAGKSILLDALGLVLGTRADPALVRQGCEKAEISALFDVSSSEAARQWLDTHELSDADEPAHCLIRRVVYAEGRTRAFVNGQAVNAAPLRELGEQLVSLFGQNESQTLLRPDVQRALLDSFGDHASLLAATREAAQNWSEAQRAIDDARKAPGRDPAELDYLRHQVGELASLQLGEDEVEQLEAEHRRLANAGRLIEDGARVQELLYGGDASVHDQLNQVAQLLAGLSPLHEGFAETESLVANAQALVREAASHAQRQLDRLELDPAQLAEVEARMAALHDMARKHRVKATALPERLASLQADLHTLEHAGEALEKLTQQRDAALARYQKAATQLTAARQKTAPRYSEAVTGIVRQLGMANAALVVVVEAAETERPRTHGADEVRFDFTANAGQAARPLAKVASGGELSRVSLAIQTAGRDRSAAPTLIFDEVDAGIGGGVAEIVGQKLRALGAQHQVLCVTHLAPVAAQGQQQFGIRKDVHNDQTLTRVQPLAGEARVLEIARMLGGQQLTTATQALARDLLQRAG